MKTNELRLGNWVMGIGYMRVTELKIELGNNFITASNKDVVYMDEEDSFQPIELTEEVLLKIGFEKFEKMFRMKLSEFHLDYFIAVGVLRIYKKLTDCYFDKNLEIKCEFLHQLQNAYYCLTNEELEVEL